MRQNNKRPADDEFQPSRTRKRQAAVPSTRITRSMRKMNESNGISMQILPGLPIASRRRNKPVPQATTQEESTAVQACGQAATHVEPVFQLAAVCSQQLSVTHETSITEEGQETCAPICAGESGRANLRCEGLAVNATEAANPGGPAPIADMGCNIPVKITSCHVDGLPQKADAWGISMKQRPRAPSDTSQISPRSGPAQVSSISEQSQTDAIDPEKFSGLYRIENMPDDTMLSWSILYPAWVEVPRAEFRSVVSKEVDVTKKIKDGDDNKLKASQTECTPAVLDATYLVKSIKEAEELLSNEMDARKVEQDQELPVVEIFPHDSAQGGPQYSEQLSPVLVDCCANGLTADNVQYVLLDEPAEVRDSRCNTATSDRVSPTEGSEASCPPTPLVPFCRSNAPSPSTTRGSISAPATEQNQPNVEPLMEPSESTCTSRTDADVSGLPKSQQKTAQQLANMKREKELRAKLIEMRRAKKATKQPCVQNVLVRAPDGSLSIITAEDAHVTDWNLEDDQYSVEEYEEDTVSY